VGQVQTFYFYFLKKETTLLLVLLKGFKEKTVRGKQIWISNSLRVLRECRMFITLFLYFLKKETIHRAPRSIII